MKDGVEHCSSVYSIYVYVRTVYLELGITASSIPLCSGVAMIWCEGAQNYMKLLLYITNMK